MSDNESQSPNNNVPWPNHPGYGHPYYHPQQAQTSQPMPPPAGYYPPPPGYYGHPHCPPPPPPGYYGHPQYAHPAYQQPQGMPHQHHGQPHHEAPDNDALYQQAQGVVEGLMGEQSGAFKEMLGKMGIDDKEFWKGAMIGAAAALILGNENVRNNLLQMFSGATDMFKTGGEKVKDSAYKATESVKQSVTTGNEIFKDTINAGKEGYQASVERHKSDAQVAPDTDLTTQEQDNEL